MRWWLRSLCRLKCNKKTVATFYLAEIVLYFAVIFFLPMLKPCNATWISSKTLSTKWLISQCGQKKLRWLRHWCAYDSEDSIEWKYRVIVLKGSMAQGGETAKTIPFTLLRVKITTSYLLLLEIGYLPLECKAMQKVMQYMHKLSITKSKAS